MSERIGQLKVVDGADGLIGFATVMRAPGAVVDNGVLEIPGVAEGEFDALSYKGASSPSATEFNYLAGVTSPIQTQIEAREPVIDAGDTWEYFRGDKTWATLDKTAVGLGSVADALQLTAANNLSDLANAGTARTNLGLGTAAVLNTGTASGDIPLLGAGGKLASAVLPAIAITDTFVVASQAAMLALTAETGDVAVRSDLNKSFILAGTDPATLAHWQELLTPTDTVLSVNGQTGVVVLTTQHISEHASNLYYTDERVDDRVAALILGTANQITPTYNDAGGTLTLSLPQNIHTGASPTFTGLTLSGNLTAAGVASHLIPSVTDTYDLGSATKLWRKGWLSELDAVLFAQNTISVIGGWLMIAKGEGAIPAGADVTNVATTINFGQAMTPNDFVIFRAAGAVEYVQVGTLVSGTTYNVTRDLDGSGANAWPAGSVYVVLGNNGPGRIELNANSTPRMSLIRQGATYNAQTELLRVGDLNGGWGYGAETYGFAVGQYGTAGQAWATVDQTNGYRLGSNTTTLWQVDASSNVIYGQVATNSNNLYWSAADKNLQFRGGAGGTEIQTVFTAEGFKMKAGDITAGTLRNLRFTEGDPTLTSALFSVGASQNASLSDCYITASSAGTARSTHLNIDAGTAAAAGSATARLLASAAAGGIIFQLNATATTLHAYLNGALKVGNASAPTSGYMFDVEGDARVNGKVNAVTGFQVNGGATSGNVLRGNGTNFVSAQLAAADLSNGVTGSGSVVLATSPTLSALTVSGALAVDTTTLVVDATNNRVGIGTASPGSTLDVQGRIYTNTGIGINTTDLTNGFMVIQAPAGTIPSITRWQQLQTGAAGANSRGLYIAFGGGTDGNTNRGYFGITHTASGSDTFWAGELADAMAFNSLGAMQLGTNNAIRLTLSTAGLMRLHAYGAGTLTTDASGNVTASSDEKLKDIKGRHTAGLAAVRKVEPIVYRWKEVTGLDTENDYIGFSAQNVRGAVPGAVGKNLDGSLTIQDRAVMCVAVNAIKELDATQTAHEKRIAQLEAELAALKLAPSLRAEFR